MDAKQSPVPENKGPARTCQIRNVRGHDIRLRILACLSMLLRDSADISGVSVQQLTAAAGITRSAFYYYFSNKYTALAELCAAWWESSADHSGWFTSPVDGEPPAQTVDRLVAGICHILANADPALKAGRRARHVDAAIEAVLTHMTSHVVDQIVTLIDAEIDRGAILPHPDVYALTHTLVGATIHSTTGSPTFIGQSRDYEGAIAAVKALWLGAVWRTSKRMGTAVT